MLLPQRQFSSDIALHDAPLAHYRAALLQQVEQGFGAYRRAIRAGDAGCRIRRWPLSPAGGEAPEGDGGVNWLNAAIEQRWAQTRLAIRARRGTPAGR